MKSFGSRIFEKALAPTVRAVDVAGLTLPPLLAGYYWLTGEAVPDDLGQMVGLVILGGGLAIIALRLVSAPYFVWREDQTKIAHLEDELASPERQADAELKLYTTGLRKDLSSALGDLAATATQPRSVLKNGSFSSDDLFSKVRKVDTLINQLSYDTAARIAAVQFRNACVEILSGNVSEGRWFYRQRQITFRILHKDDLVSDLLSLMELEIEMESRGVSTLGEGADGGESVLQELKGLVKQMDDRYYDPEIRRQLKAALKDD